MKQRKWSVVLAACTLSAVVSAGALADDRTDGENNPTPHWGSISSSGSSKNSIKGSHLGSQVVIGRADREIVIDPNTRTILVKDGETVRIVASGKAFMWNFSPLNASSFQLAEVAPKDIPVGNVRVYIEPDRSNLPNE